MAALRAGASGFVLKNVPLDELARAIRGEVRWNDIPIMLITGKSKPEDAVRAYEAGADDVILKPFHFEVLFARIDRRIDRARSLPGTIPADRGAPSRDRRRRSSAA